jgi:hypothetical protein
MQTTCKVLLALTQAAWLTSPALAQRGRSPFSGPGYVVTNGSVQKELKLTDEQAKKITSALKAVYDKLQGDFAALRKLQGDEARRKLEAVSQAVNEGSMKALADVLSAEQLKRLKQILLQQRGAQAFNDAEIQKELKLSDDQKDKIKTINDDVGQELRSIFQGRDDLEGKQKKADALLKETVERVCSVLTDEQRKVWKALVGEPFEFKPDPEPLGSGPGKKRRL